MSDTARIGAAVADAVHSLHLQDAIHLDLKPENVILKADGEAVLIDFGIAYHAHFPDLLAEEQRFPAGSAPYISPEQVLGTRSDPRSDIFALGAILYEMATGELPFGTPATMAGLRDRLWRDPIAPRLRSPEVPPWLQEIILRCLEPRADDRYQSAAHVAFDLRKSRPGAPYYLDHLARLRHWVEPLRLPPRRLSLHVIESANPETALLEFARHNSVDLIVLGAPHPAQLGLAWWRSVASRVTANASCSVHVVRVPEHGTG